MQVESPRLNAKTKCDSVQILKLEGLWSSAEKGFWCKATHPSASKNVKKYLRKFLVHGDSVQPIPPNMGPILSTWRPRLCHNLGSRPQTTTALSFLVKSHLVKFRVFKEMCFKRKKLACFFFDRTNWPGKLALINLYLNKVFGFSFNKLLVRNDLK